MVVAGAISIAGVLANFGLFVLLYNRLATPWLSEAQRVANADLIMSVGLGGFAAVGLATGLALYFALRRPAPGER